MMDPVHIRRHDNGPKDAVPLFRDREVAVMKERRNIQQGFEQQYLGKAHAQENYYGKPQECREDQFARVETERRCRVHVCIAMVGSMKQPEER